MTKKLKKGEDYLLEVEINLRFEKGGIQKVEMSKEIQKIMFSMLGNFFSGGIPFTTHSQEQN